MIKVKNDSIKIKGNGPTILSELAFAIKHVKMAFVEGGLPENIAEELVSDAVRYADMNTEELAKELIDRITGKKEE